VFSDCALGEVQGPVETDFGFHLIIVDSREGGEEKKTK
jgi:parvulin-like peptidyl-prolyl isomerase